MAPYENNAERDDRTEAYKKVIDWALLSVVPAYGGLCLPALNAKGERKLANRLVCDVQEMMVVEQQLGNWRRNDPARLAKFREENKHHFWDMEISEYGSPLQRHMRAKKARYDYMHLDTNCGIQPSIAGIRRNIRLNLEEGRTTTLLINQAREACDRWRGYYEHELNLSAVFRLCHEFGKSADIPYYPYMSTYRGAPQTRYVTLVRFKP